ncbi:MAG: hypothetical protein HYT41_01445, partial [Candidatus Sungbacteria bacterium]|nr:hypothetical protein [Candidatus Sungbacteria bacterium]
LASSLAIVVGLAFFSLQEVVVTRVAVKSADARAIADAGMEDALWRVLTARTIGQTETLQVGKGSVTLEVSGAGSARTIRSTGSRDGIKRSSSSVADTSGAHEVRYWTETE